MCAGEAEDVQVLKARLKQAEAARAAAEADTGQAAAAWDAEAAGLRKAAAAAESQAKEADALLLEAEQRNDVLLQESQVQLCLLVFVPFASPLYQSFVPISRYISHSQHLFRH